MPILPIEVKIMNSANDLRLCNFCGATFSGAPSAKGQYDMHQQQHGRLSGDKCVGRGCNVVTMYDTKTNKVWLKHGSNDGMTVYSKVMTKTGSLDELREFYDSCHSNQVKLSEAQTKAIYAGHVVLSGQGCGAEIYQCICGEYDTQGRVILCDECNDKLLAKVAPKPKPEELAEKVNRRRFRLEGEPVDKSISYPGGAVG